MVGPGVKTPRRGPKRKPVTPLLIPKILVVALGQAVSGVRSTL
jgi:hypothetical protein